MCTDRGKNHFDADADAQCTQKSKIISMLENRNRKNIDRIRYDAIECRIQNTNAAEAKRER